MQLSFYKYQGTGNDFVIIDNFNGDIDLTKDQIAHICNRKFGVGADGLMMLEKSNKYDFEMKYFNADGNLGSMCGNGGRCIVKFAHDIDLIDEHAMFLAVDGVHEATIDKQLNIISLEMINVDFIKKINNLTCELNTGSPHYTTFVDEVSSVDVCKLGREIRYSDTYKEEGVNVNFVSVKNNILQIRTYERGVENETLSCGTGVTAAALAAYELGLINTSIIKIITMGGVLEVSFVKKENSYEDVVLSGPAVHSFQGTINL